MELNIIYFVFSRKCNRLTAPKLLTNVPPSKVPNRNTPTIFPNTPTEIPKYPHYFSQITPLFFSNTPTGITKYPHYFSSIKFIKPIFINIWRVFVLLLIL